MKEVDIDRVVRQVAGWGNLYSTWGYITFKFQPMRVL